MNKIQSHDNEPSSVGGPPDHPDLDHTIVADPLDIMVDFLLSMTDYRPELGVICGSGLSGLSRCLEQPHTITYESIPGFPQATVVGHAGELVFGLLDGVSVVCMRGRFHTYEGYDIQTTTLPVRVMALLGVKTLVVTNAAGGLNPAFRVGDLMIVHDHLNLPGLAGKHPLVGPNESRFGARFTPLSSCYDPGLQRLAYQVAQDTGLGSKIRSKGVYCFVSGPTYETQIEAKFLQMLGGDAVGMSTVPEVVVAAHCGIKVLGLSLITNKVLLPGDDTSVAASHDEVLEAVKATQSEIEHYVGELIRRIGSYDAAQCCPDAQDREGSTTHPCETGRALFGPVHWLGAGIALGVACSALLVFTRSSTT